MTVKPPTHTRWGVDALLVLVSVVVGIVLLLALYGFVRLVIDVRDGTAPFGLSSTGEAP